MSQQFDFLLLINFNNVFQILFQHHLTAFLVISVDRIYSGIKRFLRCSVFVPGWLFTLVRTGLGVDEKTLALNGTFNLPPFKVPLHGEGQYHRGALLIRHSEDLNRKIVEHTCRRTSVSSQQYDAELVLSLDCCRQDRSNDRWSCCTATWELHRQVVFLCSDKHRWLAPIRSWELTQGHCYA